MLALSALNMQAGLERVSPSLTKLPNELRKPSWASGSQGAVRCPPGSQKVVRLLESDCLLRRSPASAASAINNVKAGAPERRRVVLWRARRKGRYSWSRGGKHIFSTPAFYEGRILCV